MTNYDDDQISVSSVAKKWGLYIGLALIVFDLLLYVLGLKDPTGANAIQYLGVLIFIAMLMMSIKAFRDENGSMTFGQGVGVGVLTSIIGSVLVAIWIYVFASFIDPEFMNHALEATTEQLESDGMSDEQIELSLKYMKMFMSPGAMAMMSVLWYGFLGFLLSLLGSAIMKR